MALRSRARSTRLLVVALVSISLVTITVDYRQGDDGALSALGDAALVVISPLQEAVSKVTRPIGNFFSTLFRLPSIRHERDVLRDRVSALETQLAETEADQTRLAELEALLGLRDEPRPEGRDHRRPGDRERRVELRVDDHDRPGFERRHRRGACRSSPAPGSSGTSCEWDGLVGRPAAHRPGLLRRRPARRLPADRAAVRARGGGPPDEPGRADDRGRRPTSAS